MKALTLVAVALAIAVSLAPAAAGADKTRGTFQTLPAGTDLGLEIEGIAQLTRTDDGTTAKIVARGLEPGTTYASHLHNAPCSAANPGGAHYQDDPLAAPMPPNELWLSSTDDPMAGIAANEDGVAQGAAPPTGSRGPRHSRS